MIGLPYDEKNYDSMLSRFHTTRKRTGRTDRRTERFSISISRVSMLTRDKNVIEWTYVLKQLLPGVTNHQYHLRQRRHNHCITVKTDDRNFVRKQLFKDLYWYYVHTSIYYYLQLRFVNCFTVLMNEWMNQDNNVKLTWVWKINYQHQLMYYFFRTSI